MINKDIDHLWARTTYELGTGKRTTTFHLWIAAEQRFHGPLTEEELQEWNRKKLKVWEDEKARQAAQDEWLKKILDF